MQRSEVKPKEIKISVTALSVLMAYKRALAAGYDDRITPRDYQLIRQIAKMAKEHLPGFSKGLAYLIDVTPLSFQSSLFEKLAMTAYDESTFSRKLMIQQKIEAAIQNGFENIVFIGGGFDPRAFLNALKHPQVHFYELDRGPTRALKMKALATLPAKLGYQVTHTTSTESTDVIFNGNLFCIECDVNKNKLDEVLSQHKLKPGKTLFIAEGLTMYLTENENRELLKAFVQAAKPGDEFLSGFITAVVYNSKISKKSMKDTDESYKFAIPSTDIISFADKSALAVTGKFNTYGHLRQLGKEAKAKKVEKAGLETEMYYLFQKSAEVNTVHKKIEDVPALPLDVHLKQPKKQCSPKGNPG